MERKLNAEIFEKLQPNIEISANDEFAKETRFKHDRLAQKVGLLEARIQNVTTEMREAFTKLSTKITTSNLDNEKTEAIINRHNQIVHSFESKLLHLQRIMEEQEIQLTSTLEELQQARAEIARLKRFK